MARKVKKREEKKWWQRWMEKHKRVWLYLTLEEYEMLRKLMELRKAGSVRELLMDIVKQLLQNRELSEVVKEYKASVEEYKKRMQSVDVKYLRERLSKVEKELELWKAYAKELEERYSRLGLGFWHEMKKIKSKYGITD